MMRNKQRLKIAIQKNGKLNSRSLNLLTQSGIKITLNDRSFYYPSENFPIDVLLVRDDDIPTLVSDGVCDFGIVGENVLSEQSLSTQNKTNGLQFTIIKSLRFGQCRLSLATLKNSQLDTIQSLSGKKIATSYPALLNQYLTQQNIKAEVLTIKGSVEIAPRLEMASAICDLVSTGRTLEENNLQEIATLLNSQAVLIKTKKTIPEEKSLTAMLLLRRIDGVLKASESKYIMFHAPRDALSQIQSILPGIESPTVLPLENNREKMVVHVVSREGVFWDTLEKLKAIGASSILVLPIEKMMN